MLRALVASVLERGAKRVAAIMRERGEYAEIERDSDALYMVRYYWTKLVGVGESYTKRAGSFIHEFVSSDLPELVHNHPWTWMVSVILSPSGYKEVRYEWSPALMTLAGGMERAFLQEREVRHHGPLSINVIRDYHAHRVELYGEQPCWTLFIHGPRHDRGWGFIDVQWPHAYREVRRPTHDLRKSQS